MDIQYLRNISPFRYPGSKQKIVRYLEEIVSFNALNLDIIVEPFVGGGSVFLYFLLCGIATKAIIADKDKLVYSFWKTVFLNPNLLCDFVSDVKVDLDTYYSFKEISKDTRGHQISDLAKACLFLNRTSFSGIMAQTSGPIGGKRQRSRYKIECRFNRDALIDKITYISSLKNQVTVLNYDWQKTINYAKNKANNSEKLFYYLDPPFFKKAKDLYRTFFNNDEHQALCDFLCQLDDNWILSYDNALEIRRMYSKNKYRPISTQMPYSINSHATRIEKELIITPLNLPRYKKK